MKKQEIVSVLYELYKITGFRISLYDADCKEVAAYPPEKLAVCRIVHAKDGELEKCRACDAAAFKRVNETQQTFVYKCRFGLTEAISPLYNFGKLTGYLMMGQILDSGADKEELFDKLVALGNPRDRMRRCVNTMRTVPEEMISSYIRIITICAQYLTLSNAMPGAKPTVSEAAKRFIYENIDKRITIKDICCAVGCSKTNLISSYKRDFGTTVNAAITDAKLDEAKRLLETEDISISRIAEMTGFYDQSYFSKVFSLKCGISPSEYRKQNTEEKI